MPKLHTHGLFLISIFEFIATLMETHVILPFHGILDFRSDHLHLRILASHLLFAGEFRDVPLNRRLVEVGRPIFLGDLDLLGFRHDSRRISLRKTRHISSKTEEGIKAGEIRKSLSVKFSRSFSTTAYCALYALCQQISLLHLLRYASCLSRSRTSTLFRFSSSMFLLQNIDLRFLYMN